MSEDWLDVATEIATSVSYQVHKRYKVYFDAADVRQELVLWAIRKQHKVKEWTNPTQEKEDLAGGIKQLATAMRREADKYCRTEKAKAVGYETRDEAFYNIGVIEELLAHIGELETPQLGLQMRVSSGGSDPATGGNFTISLIDVRSAFNKLNPADRLMLEMRYQEGLTLQQCADALEMPLTTVHRHINHALEAMVEDLGGDSPWVYAVKKPSGRAGQAIVANQ